MKINFYGGVGVTNLEWLRKGDEDDIQKLLISFAYRSGHYTWHDRQVKEWLEDEAKTNANGEIII